MIELTDIPIRTYRACKAFSWLPREEIEDGAWEQITNLVNLPSAVHVAVMPDAHKGYGMPIGTVLATQGTIVPYAVGVDIGCGMIAVKTSLNVEGAPRELVRKALEGIFARVPVGQPGRGLDRDAGSFTARQNSEVIREWADVFGESGIRERADRQVGTLGGGNHFIEIQSDGTNVWLMLHTGSRGFGKFICDWYYEHAKVNCSEYFTPLPDKELAFLTFDSREGQDYLRDMRFAMRYAEESRARIKERSLEAMHEAFGNFKVIQEIETHHNFAAVEQHLGKRVVVHRKGAVKTVSTTEVKGEPFNARLDPGTFVIIPGSMQTGSYIGLGQPSVLALNTCSHGAGRRLGRKAAQREYAAARGLSGAMQPGAGSILADMDAAGIEIVVPTLSDVVDEGGFAYKDIENVMRYQADLVEPVVRLTPLGVVKG